MEKKLKELINEAKSFEKRAEIGNQIGDKLDILEILEFIEGMGEEENIEMKIPEWYIILTTNFNLVGIEFEYEIEYDYNLVITICNLDSIKLEMKDTENGEILYKEGFLCIGDDVTGSGDSLFISLNEVDLMKCGIYQIAHDDIDYKELIAENIVELFKRAKFKIE